MQNPDNTTVEDFLSAGDPSGSALLADLGRVLEISGSLLVVGIMAFAIVCLPEKRPSQLLETLLIVLGLVIAVGAVTEASGMATVLDLTFAELLSDRRLDGALFRVLAGTLIAFGALAPTRWRQLSLLLGASLSATSFGLDGHTVSEGPRLLMVALNLSHVLAAGVWSGGSFALLITIIQSRAGHRSETAETSPTVDVANRFASLATATLIPVIVAGVIMSFLVLGSWSDLFGTAWGRLLLIKMVAVMAALAVGAHHHFRVVPRLAQRPELFITFRRTVTIELMVFGTIAVLTAFLVSASTTQ